MKKLITLSFLFVFMLAIPSYAQSPELGKDKIDLKAFSLKFNVNDFYKNQIKTHKKSVSLYAQGKTKDALSKELLKDYRGVENTDTLHIGDNKYLVFYLMKTMRTKDTLATFENITFQKLDMVANDRNEFQSLRATSWAYKQGKKNFDALKYKLENFYGKPLIIGQKFQHEEYYEWAAPEFIVSLTLDKDEDMNFITKLYLTSKSEYENFKANVIGKTKYYWIY